VLESLQEQTTQIAMDINKSIVKDLAKDIIKNKK